MIEVWHLNIGAIERERMFDITFGHAKNHVEIVEKAWKEGLYTKVAEVEGHNLDAAYMMTNNLNTSWSITPDPDVKVTEPLKEVNGETYGHKSSSIGDVLVLCWGNGDRFSSVVSTFGFTNFKE